MGGRGRAKLTRRGMEREPTLVNNGRILALAIVAFVAVASGLLIWDGLAAEFASERAKPREVWKTRARLAVGIVGFGVAVWVGLGMLTHAR